MKEWAEFLAALTIMFLLPLAVVILIWREWIQWIREDTRKKIEEKKAGK